MAITTDTTLTLRSLTVGVSKPFDQIYSDGDYTLDELIKFSWCSWSDKVVRCWTETTYDSTIPAAPMALLSYIQTHDGTSPAYYTPQYVDDRYQTKDFYCFNILLYNSTNASPRAITSSNASSYRLVTDIDITKIYCNCGTAAINTVNYKYPAVSTYQYADSMADGYYEVFEKATDLNVSGLIPACVLIGENDEIYITHGFMFPGMDYRDANDTAGTHYNNSFIDYSLAIPTGNLTSQQHFSVNNAKIYNYDKSKNILTWLDNGFSTQDLLNEPTNGTYNAFFPIDEHTYFALHQSSGSMSVSYCQSSIGVRDIETLLTEMSFVGLYFKVNGTMYKPVIGSNNVVEGYTDDLDADSQIDNITNVTGNTISPVPTPPTPPPPPDPDDDDKTAVSTVGAPFGTGLAHYYVTTVDSAVLGQISEALGTWDIDSTKKDLYRNLISCKILKPPAGIPSTPSVFEIYGVKPQYNGADITIPAVNGNPDISFGPYTISRKFNDFRDYAPYTRAEIFLPYCGWCALPSHVVGRSVSVSYFTDVIAGTVKAVVFCGENPVAEAAGVMAYDIPFAAQNVGAKIQAANTGMLAYGKAALQLSAGIGQAVATKGKQGIGSIVSGAFGVAAGYNQLSMAANENYTEISGKAGDGCALAGIDTIIIKIVRPKYGAYTTAPYVPDGFAHTVGFLSMKQAKVSAASGLILCDNVDTSGIGKATDAERAEIKRVLETGLYVNNPPE